MTLGQGFYLAEPMEAAGFGELLGNVAPGEPIVSIAGDATVIQLRSQRSA